VDFSREKEKSHLFDFQFYVQNHEIRILVPVDIVGIDYLKKREIERGSKNPFLK